MKLTNKEARQLMLYHQGLLQQPLKGKSAVMTYVKHVGCLQFDPLNVITINPQLVLQSRIKNYKTKWLDELLYKDRLLMDGWDKCMSIYPIEDRPYFTLQFEKAFERHTKHFPELKKYVNDIRTFIDENGPVTSSDIKIKDKLDWYWAPTSVSRAVLDLMFYTGELTIYNKKSNRKMYEFSHKLLPDSIIKSTNPTPTLESYHKWAVLRRIRSLGFVWDKRSDMFLEIDGLKTKERKAALLSLVKDGQLIKMTIEGIDEDFYVLPEVLKHLEDSQKRYHRRVSFIAPLDNMIWDRKLIKALFGFDYKWEVYTPAKDRKYGYYVLPILFGLEFIGRIEPRYDKKTKTLKILNIWIDTKEKGFEKPLLKAIKALGNVLGANSFDIDTNSKTIEQLNLFVPLKMLNEDK